MVFARDSMTVLNQFFRVTFRKKLYYNLEEIQADLDSCLDRYNNERTNQGAWWRGMTPMQSFKESLNLVKERIWDEMGAGNAHLSTVVLTKT